MYNYTDHLGNVRLSYFNNGSGVEVLEENNYYPFGLKYQGYNILSGSPSYQYKYQGQELQETGFYSFKYRTYMPDTGRFMQLDPLAEKFPYNSTYAIQENKMGMGIELEGLELLLENKQKEIQNQINQIPH
ncbi:RHS repeat domain-containing protein [Chryseobacterium fistulae]|uniref:RHS repeat domain-containing protein n=1 Tax=Chryseobacterium fistulae TaxID=2675058 RepID=UPI001389D1A2|nr:RHS repeat-associated core domain-containing protein [Chryseobacterium fistulae]